MPGTNGSQALTIDPTLKAVCATIRPILWGISSADTLPLPSYFALIEYATYAGIDTSAALAAINYARNISTPPYRVVPIETKRFALAGLDRGLRSVAIEGDNLATFDQNLENVIAALRNSV